MDAKTFLRDHVALFAGVTDENLTSLAQASSIKTYNAGQTILFKGETVDGLHVVVSGMAGVYVKTPDKTILRVADLGSGDVFGEMSIVEMGIAGAAIKSVDPDTSILMIPQEAFRHVLQQDEGFAVRVNVLIAARRKAAATSETPA